MTGILDTPLPENSTLTMLPARLAAACSEVVFKVVQPSLDHHQLAGQQHDEPERVEQRRVSGESSQLLLDGPAGRQMLGDVDRGDIANDVAEGTGLIIHGASPSVGVGTSTLGDARHGPVDSGPGRPVLDDQFLLAFGGYVLGVMEGSSGGIGERADECNTSLNDYQAGFGFARTKMAELSDPASTPEDLTAITLDIEQHWSRPHDEVLNI
ncbi:hypothetical protein [Mycobacterium sp. IS-1556]|uniref:hypothetical protein n=1 Tax=Mycobacterium sp. IS-1556 TaxID=1772276 RepID=UPI0012E35BCA|nr:hypothetical protein [Mycobacterium sp. IS-1556]